MPNFEYEVFIFSKQLLNIFDFKDQAVIIRVVFYLSFLPRPDANCFYSVKVTYPLTTYIRNKKVNK